MIGSLFSFIVTVAYPTGSDTISQGVLDVISSISIAISLLMLPINIRLAAQLIMQVFKYRYIVKQVAQGDVDTQVMTGYYDHFRAIMCIIVCMVGFNVFNVISTVHFIVFFAKSDWEGANWTMFLAEGLYSAFQEGIILFAVTMLYQIACYFQENKVRFGIIFIFAIVRFFYIIIQVGVINNVLLYKYFNKAILSMTPIQSTVITYLTYVFLSLFLMEPLFRFPLVFSFIRASQRVVKTYIEKFNTDLNTQFLERSYYVDKIRAGRLFQIAGWGTIVVSFFTSFSVASQYSLAILLYIFFFFVYNITGNIVYEIVHILVLVLLTIIQVLAIMPTILYSLFLIALWLYFRYKTKAKYSGYSSNDPKVLELVHPDNDMDVSTTTNQDALHTTHYKHKNKIIVISYVVIVLMVSLAFACFFAPLLTNKWKETIQLKPGDYYLLDENEMKNKLSYCPMNEFSIDCQINTIFAAKFVQPRQIEYKTYKYIYQSSPNDDPYAFTIYNENQFWIPDKSVLIASRPSYYNSDTKFLPHMVIETEDPCYVGLYDGYNLIFEFGLFRCKKAITNQDFSHTSECNVINDTLVNCTILNSGMFKFNSFYIDGQNYLNYNNNPITVRQFGYEVNESTLVSLNEAKSDIDKYDVIISPASENITNLDPICTVEFTCNFSLAFPILIPVTIFIVSLVGLTLSLICIHKI